METEQQLATTRAGTMITRIVLQGFKSFNKRISIPLLPGFNVICGPNGVGKSNILDAIAFQQKALEQTSCTNLFIAELEMRRNMHPSPYISKIQRKLFLLKNPRFQ